jgi:hypothetical protein
LDGESVSKREELLQIARTVRGEQLARIKAMTRDEKYAELNEYFKLGGVLNLDVDALKKDQVMLNLPDTALDEALMICAGVVGKLFNRLPMSPEELKAHIPVSDWARAVDANLRRAEGIRRPPEFSLRRNGKVKPLE